MHSHFFPVVMKLSLIIVTITLIHCPASLRADNEKYLTCEAPFNCSNLVNLSYPFWASNRPNYCGHPSFQLNCSSSVPQINIATMNYSVLEIVDSSRTLRVARTDYLDTICPAALVNTTIDNNLFSYITSADTNLTLYYNCRSPLAAIPNLPFYQFNCSINSSTNFINYYTLTSQTFLAISNLIGACSYWVNVPVLQSAVPTATTYDAVIAAIDSGFMLGWNASNSQCDTCLRAGGLCGSVPNTSTFACHCTNGTFASGCSTESTRPTINRLELVAVVNASSPAPHSPTTVPVVYPRSPTPHSPTTVPVVYPRPPFNVPAAEVPGHPPTQHPTPAPFTVPPQIVVPFSKRNWRLIIAIGIPASAVGILVISTVIICMFKRGHLSCNAIVCWKGDAKNNHINAEEFIKNYGSIVPKRYTYSEVKKLTNSLKEKIGQGGFGAVYKGQLPDGRMVAVKVLKQSNGNGEEFINEVASISRTSHVNVVALLGFCYERNKRALIYEFMSNGSLNKFIYDKRNRCLDRNTMFQISVGIARGLEYLHCGCRTRILHFDIKPHNILLDEDLCPKISDFGLAKLCKIKESIISMTGMRGTIGYIAPEVFNRNFGGVSHKSDVYSYGMLILEMIGGRKNFDGEASHTSELYFPHWVYKKLELGESFGALGGITEEEEDTLKKMMIVSLWCIQTNPRNRPSMSKVIEMLEGTLQSLQLPKPFLDSPRRSPQNSFGNSSLS